jgi:hypothetical protein
MSNSIQYLDLPGIFGAIQQIQGGQQKSRLLDLQSQMEQQKLTTAAATLARQQELFSTITDPNERRLAELDPEAYTKAKADSLYGKPDLMAVPKGGGVYDKRSNQVIFSQPDNDVYFGDTPPSAAPPSPSANLQRAAPTPQPAATAPQVPVTPAGGAGFPDAVKAGENTTGNPAAPNPNSSAVGDHQFLAGTWLDVVKTHRPDLAQGKTDEQILELRTKPGISAEITSRYAADNAKVLQGAGFEATPTNLAILHRYGPTGGVRILTTEKANPNTPLASVLSPEALAANPELKDLTIAQGRARLEGHMQQAQAPQGTQGNYEIRYEKGKPTEYPGKPGYVVAREKGTGRVVAVPAPNAGQTQADIDRAEKDRREVADRQQKQTTDAEGTRFDQETKLRVEHGNAIKGFDVVQSNYAAMQDLVKDETGGSDIAFVISFFKTSDPGSTVMEGEFANAARAAGMGDRIAGYLTKLDQGDILTPTQRQELLKAAGRYHEQRLKDAEAANERYRKLAIGYKVDPERVVLNPIRPQTEKPPPEQKQATIDADAARAELRRRGVIQ